MMFSAPGSSPLTRGKHLKPGMPLRYSRLIPAHAGKTRRLPSTSSVPSAHPRSRGENRDIFKFYEKPPGSSPLTRGKRRRPRHRARPRGLIPAHAGKTSLPFGAKMKGTAHPRSRGENLRPAKSPTASAGSSPLTRGKRPHERNTEVHIRLIPAHAGKTESGGKVWNRATAHPRSRGENGRAAASTVAT